jgi:hypothetical protein
MKKENNPFNLSRTTSSHQFAPVFTTNSPKHLRKDVPEQKLLPNATSKFLLKKNK